MLIRMIIRSTLGIKDHRVVHVTGNTIKLVIHLELISHRRLPCSGCGRRYTIRDRLQKRTWSHVPLWNIPVFISYRPARVKCPDCGIKTLEQRKELSVQTLDSGDGYLEPCFAHGCGQSTLWCQLDSCVFCCESGRCIWSGVSQ